MDNETENITAGLVQDGDNMLNEEEQLAVNFFKACIIHANDKFDKPRFALSKNGIGFSPLGNIMAICAEMKMGKSWLMQQLAVAVLKGDYMGIICDLDFETSVLYIDTEQDKYDAQMIMRRVQYLNGWDFKTDNPRFTIASMRDFDTLFPDKSMPENRIIGIDAAIKYLRPTVVFIDGVRDLIEDFNDLTESARLVQHLMSLSSQYDCSIWSVLHVNPNSDKMRGHLGTELGNKTTDVFSVHKNKDDVSGQVTFEVKQVAARHRDVDDWLFKIDDNQKFAVPVLVDATDSRKKELKSIFDKAFNEKGISAMSRSEMYDLIHKIYPKRKATIIDWVNDGIKLGMIIEVADKFTYNNSKVPF